MMDQQQLEPLHLLVLLLFLSCLLPLDAVAPSASPKLKKERAALERAAEQVASKGMAMAEASVIERMDIESNDYPGSGANNRHNPHPGRP